MQSQHLELSLEGGFWLDTPLLLLDWFQQLLEKAEQSMCN
ncbi:MAG: hypothetical protein ACI82I_001664 [Gammaproteobacteria bacterium]|jgi:hypothetical protein